MGPLLLQLAQSKSANENLFAFEADDIVKVFAEACQILKLPIDTVLYQCRHGGASHDLLHSRREFQVIKQRGRWATDTSIRRYAKQGRVQRLVGSIEKRESHFCDQATMRIGPIRSGNVTAVLP